jgi:hypothetical protein
MILPILLIAGALVAVLKIHSDDKRRQIQDALRIMKRVLTTKRDAPAAMRRDEIGVIGFRYGRHDPATRTRKRAGYGLAHVIGSAKEDFGKYEGSPTPEEILSIIPEVILDGDISPAHGNRLRIEHKGHLVLLTKSGKQKEATKWLFHAYKLWPKK